MKIFPTSQRKFSISSCYLQLAKKLKITLPPLLKLQKCYKYIFICMIIKKTYHRSARVDTMNYVWTNHLFIIVFIILKSKHLSNIIPWFFLCWVRNNLLHKSAFYIFQALDFFFKMTTYGLIRFPVGIYKSRKNKNSEKVVAPGFYHDQKQFLATMTRIKDWPQIEWLGCGWWYCT